MRFHAPAGSIALLRALLIAVVAAAVCVWLKTPLPWMIGPLLSTAAARMAGLDLRAPVQVREAGQWAIGTALGLYFTPAVLQTLASFVGYIAAAVLFALLLGAACGWLLQRLTGVDRTTAFFAMATGGASEMATQGERHGAQVDRVAAAHSLRIMLVVLIIPFGFRFAGVHGSDPYLQGARMVALPGLLALIALTSCGALLRRMQWPNAWVIGPLLVAIALTANSVSLSALPQWMVNCGQLFIGLSLGIRFTPAFVHTAPRYLGGVALCALTALLAAAAFGLLLALLSGIDPATAILATSPGGIAEMSLTAKTLPLGVPIGPLFRLIKWLKIGSIR